MTLTEQKEVSRGLDKDFVSEEELQFRNQSAIQVRVRPVKKP